MCEKCGKRHVTREELRKHPLQKKKTHNVSKLKEKLKVGHREKGAKEYLRSPLLPFNHRVRGAKEYLKSLCLLFNHRVRGMKMPVRLSPPTPWRINKVPLPLPPQPARFPGGGTGEV